ncbi:ABC transporter ATP-binding protein [Metamycoplasma hyosynoviae]|uniref:ABC transporter ATP-binding protein n=1 Tax=Metamycoplasma hyosynoviae TaxID=29559 RepID=UPI0020C8C720|nr:ABC transporter ATP-binding protein [Metamycoplasma hyosynoviae]MDC8963448.1 ABC transporter ATP-binding protein [Metamycoplasma hyosynoviae]MDD1358909.1 ABC transporter ATP-binding protein [Metamycoplasma hyosynoviae]MDD1361606.1 ABC transporter ATP-binding protein [Metamycoplasma hyosynoviae]MDD1374272.1 ABC transporter ATP-binding protein [Metamycoplasma hyosynoviae]UTO26936.1 ABC transporter ATP-binding protein/permease [Metamycoplasma hyosynoviae]
MNKSYFNPFYSQKNPKEMTPDEKKAFKKKQDEVRKETIKELVKYLSYRRGIMAIVVFLSILNALFSSGSTFILGIIADKLLGFNQLKIGGDFNLLFFIVGIGAIALVYILSKTIDVLISIIIVKMVTYAIKIMRGNAYKALMKMPISFFDSINAAEVMTIISSDADNVVFGLSDTIQRMLDAFFLVVISFGFMFYFSPYLALVVLLLIPLTFSFTSLIMKKSIPHLKKQQDRLTKMSSYIQEHLKIHHLIKSFNQIEKSNRDFKVKTHKFFKSTFKASLYSEIIYPYALASSYIIQFIVGFLGIIFFMNNISTGSGQPFSVGILTSFGIYIRVMSMQVTFFFQNFAHFQISLISTARILQITKLKPQIDESKLSELYEIKGDVEFKNVSFSYLNKEDNLQLKKASFKAKKGQTFAIVGPTGAGKTTIINLLSKFYLPLSGEIKIDGKLSSQINESSWRNQISIVLQDTFLFKTTIMENLRYANKKATDDEIIQAAKLSKADEFIMQLKNGYNEIILEGGSNLSHGERQLIAITRAIIANKSILILDEATSNIDTRTEKYIQKAMLNLMKGKTSFVIAHRLSTIINADKILVVNNGEIIESGTHKELLSKKGFYEKLYNSAFSED